MLGNCYVIERSVVHGRSRAMAKCYKVVCGAAVTNVLNDAMRSDSIAL